MCKMSLIPGLICVFSVICRGDLGALTCASVSGMSFRHRFSTWLLPQRLVVSAWGFVQDWDAASLQTVLPELSIESRIMI